MVEKLKIHDGGTSVFSKNTVTSYDSFCDFFDDFYICMCLIFYNKDG